MRRAPDRFDASPRVERTRGDAESSWAARRAQFAQRVASSGRGEGGTGVSPANAFAIALFAVFAPMLFLALLGATFAYQQIADDRSFANDERSGTSLLANVVRAADATDAVSATDGPEGRALVLTEHLPSGDFQTRLYLSQGWVVQDYAVAGSPLNPDAATPLTRSQSFWFEVGPTSVTLGCDAGETTVALRSDGAVATDAEGAGTGGADSSAEDASTAGGASAPSPADAEGSE